MPVYASMDVVQPSISQVLEWMKDYNKNYHALERLEGDYIAALALGGGIAQYGEESAMPKAQGGTSDKTQSEAIKLIKYKESKVMNNLYISVKYLQHRSFRINRERHALVYYYRIKGYTCEEIAEIIGISRTGVQNILRKIAKVIIGIN